MSANKIRSNFSLGRKVEDPVNIEPDITLTETEREARNILEKKAHVHSEVDKVKLNEDDTSVSSIISDNYGLREDKDR